LQIKNTKLIIIAYKVFSVGFPSKADAGINPSMATGITEVIIVWSSFGKIGAG